MHNKLFVTKKSIFLLIAILFSILILEYPKNIAQSQNSNNNKILFTPPTPEDNGAPAGNRKGAGSQGLCKITDLEKDIAPLIAIMPEVPVKTATKDKNYVWGETISSNPTFWFYIAYPVNSQVEFILQDEAEKEIYKTTFKLDKTPGIVSLTLPKNKLSLETNNSYYWYIYVTCNPESSPDDFVEGWIKRVDLISDINKQLESAKPLERIAIYAENGLWFDTLNSIDRLRQIEPENNNLSIIWSDLLQQIGLDKISQKPIIKNYNLTN